MRAARLCLALLLAAAPRGADCGGGSGGARGLRRERSSPRRESHYSVRGRGAHACAGERDVRANCTRCAPGWLGSFCAVPVAVSPCTLPHCLDLGRRGCVGGGPLTLHVWTPDETPGVTGGDPALLGWLNATQSEVWTEIVSGLRASARHVTSPDEACLLVPWFDTACAGNSCTNPGIDTVKSEWLAGALWRLPGWERARGSNTLLIDLSSNHAPRLPVGRGIYVATSFWASDDSYRHGYDLSLPLWNLRWGEYLGTGAARARRSGARPMLLTFKGQRMFFCQSCAPEQLTAALLAEQGGSNDDALRHGWVRNRLDRVHDGAEIFTVASCTRELANPNSCDDTCRARCAAEEAEAASRDYEQLLRESRFGLVLPGITPMSYRLAETMAAGAIPVILSDYMVLPFESLLDWSSFSLRFPEAQLEAVPPVLRGMAAEQVASMRDAAADAYERCFATPSAAVLCAVAELELRLAPYRA